MGWEVVTVLFDATRVRLASGIPKSELEGKLKGHLEDSREPTNLEAWAQQALVG